MKSLNSLAVLHVALLLGVTQPLLASTFKTVDVSSYVNSNDNYHPASFPVGLSSGNRNTGVPFDLAAYHGFTGEWKADHSASSFLDVKVQASGQASFYALLNNIYGTQGADEYDVTVKATNGDSVTYQSIGGVDTRDFNTNVFTNTIADTTVEWDNNGIGQRIDMREFNLPGRFFNETISDFIITQVNPRDGAIFAGVTFSDAPTPAPEPVSMCLFAGGLVLLGIYGTLRRRTARASS